MKRFVVGCLFYLCAFSAFSKPVEIVMWHALAGDVGGTLNQFIRAFNESQDTYLIKPIYKGSYAETLTAFAAAYRAHTAPALLQVFEIGSTTMLHPVGVIKPVGKLLKEQQVATQLDAWWPALKYYYVQQGELMAFPLNVSLPIMYYNVERLKQLGYTAENFPRTWNQFEILLSKLKTQGAACGYTTAYPGWIHIESFMALHGLMDEPKHGLYDSPVLRHHLKRLRRWQQQHKFEYAGRIDEATILFTSGRCALFSQSSGAYTSLAQVVPFHVGVASLPYDDAFVNKRAPNVVGGGALWVVAGQPPAVEAGIAQFFKFMMRPDVQSSWYQKTGYLPIYKQQDAGILALVQSEWGEEPLHSPPHFIQAQQRIRAMNDELMESLFAGLISVESMSASLMKNSHYAQYRFEKNHGMG
ncbi:MAG: extracellular solute-binding protein [Gammaproteobacteria bacterium]|nr:extracellular solute-binding protein [Gammaproteobacteria bacterium]